MGMDVAQKLEILADAAKYDVACTSSGVSRTASAGTTGAAVAAGCCHSWTPDGRCVSLLKVLMSNACSYDCAYCVNRVSNDRTRRATFAPRELAELTMGMYLRNYVEGLFLSSAVLGTPDATSERMLQTLHVLRDDMGFSGYVHAKVVPGTSPDLVDRLGRLADRLSVNLELPSQKSLCQLAPQKTKEGVLAPMRRIQSGIAADRGQRALARRRRQTVYMTKARRSGASALARAPRGRAFAPAGQSTQMIVGATPESDYQVLNVSSALYRQLGLKRVFFSAYVPVVSDPRLPSDGRVQLDREHRLFQADWLMRFYGFDVDEVVSPEHPFLDADLDPKAGWALRHLDLFPVEVNTADAQELLRVPGIGPRGASLIVQARRTRRLSADDLSRIGIAYKRARYFVTCNGRYAAHGVDFTAEAMRRVLASPIDGGSHGRRAARPIPGQTSLFDEAGRPIDAVAHEAEERLATGTPTAARRTA